MRIPLKSFFKRATENSQHLVFYNIVVILLANLSIIYAITCINTKNIKKGVNHEVHLNEKLNAAGICKLHNCMYIFCNDTLYEYKSEAKKLTLVPDEIDPVKTLFQFSEDGYLTSDLDLYIDLSSEIDGYMVLDKSYILDIMDSQSLIVLLIFAALNISLFLIGLRNHNLFKYRSDRRRDSAIYTQSLIILAENLHHELNTPLAVIINKINKIENIIKTWEEKHCVLTGKASCFKIDTSIEKDFKLINYSITQISDILNKMKQFKVLKQSKDNRTLYNVIETTTNVLLVTQSEKFKFEIDPKLKNYKANCKYIKNGELTGILLNMLKNSIEAHASSIKITIGMKKNKNLGIYIADNGNGIPISNIKKIFNEDFSTKYDPRSGNGLFINKFLLNSSNGSIKLINTSNEGTIFEINIPVVDIKGEK